MDFFFRFVAINSSKKTQFMVPLMLKIAKIQFKNGKFYTIDLFLLFCCVTDCVLNY